MRHCMVDAAGDTKPLADALRAVADQPENFAALRDRARDRSLEFSWKRTAKLTIEVYETARRIFRH